MSCLVEPLQRLFAADQIICSSERAVCNSNPMQVLVSGQVAQMSIGVGHLLGMDAQCYVLRCPAWVQPELF